MILIILLALFFLFNAPLHSMERPNPQSFAHFVKDPSKKTEKAENLFALVCAQLKNRSNIAIPVPEGEKLLQESVTTDAFLKTTELLLAYQVDPNQLTSANISPLYSACNHLAYETVRALLKSGAIVVKIPLTHSSPLHCICDPEKDSIIRKKIARRLLIAELLIAHGANPCERNSMGKTCFDYLATNPLERFDNTILMAEDAKLLLAQRAELLEILSKNS